MGLNPYALLADAVVIAHLTLVFAVLLSVPAILIGAVLKRAWAYHPWFRSSHLLTFVIIYGFYLCSIPCPLTTLEVALRRQGGRPGYARTFIGEFARRFPWVEMRDDVFYVIYIGIGVSIVALYLAFPPRRRVKPSPLDSTSFIE